MAAAKRLPLDDVIDLLPAIVEESRLHRLADGQLVEERIVCASRATWEADPRSKEDGWALSEPIPGRVLATRLFT